MSSPTDLRPYLRTLDAETLADLLHAQAERDPVLRQALENRFVTQGSDVAEAHRLLDTAVLAGNVEYAAKVGSVLDTLQRLLDAGSRADLAPLARRTVDDISEMLEQIDDTSGEVADRLDRAVELYARACVARPPDPESLAAWILEVEFDGPGWPVIELADFASALGEKGIARIQSTVDKVLAEQPSGAKLETAERLREELAEVSGDVDALVAILAAKPPRVDVSLKIVRVLRAAGRHSEAIAHAARALTHDKKEEAPPPEKEPLSRKDFDASPTAATYLALRAESLEAGCWVAQRKTALARLRELAAGSTQAADELVRALLGEDRADEAWRAAVRFEASLPVRVELADARSVAHPAETIPVYRDHVEELITRKDPNSYREAARQLRKLRTVHKKAGMAEEFSSYLGTLVEIHKRKTRLIAEVKAARIAIPKTVTAPATGRYSE
ncbi:hypothetical protein [Amycolatopsis sp. EV170708-02-1]|uniref:hypothetical protein n=1 Tax=Amycolatopsis sp. EV170708-02-1 TaxID=2919322 RepID=UPI001F0C1F60|nr:hypothetical protein [Amycolatopsis sp. EV170708-02-1]UMP02652.1 hypothetical protein MJQ72_40920 [Amycolatopsis sp. EV170708-02-1]